MSVCRKTLYAFPSVCLSVSLPVSRSQKQDVLISPNFEAVVRPLAALQQAVHVSLCTSGFVDDVTIVRNRPAKGNSCMGIRRVSPYHIIIYHITSEIYTAHY